MLPPNVLSISFMRTFARILEHKCSTVCPYNGVSLMLLVNVGGEWQVSDVCGKKQFSKPNIYDHCTRLTLSKDFEKVYLFA